VSICCSLCGHFCRSTSLRFSVFLIVVIIGESGGCGRAPDPGVVLSARERGFVLAARGFGASDAYLIRRHILPLTAGVVLTQATS